MKKKLRSRLFSLLIAIIYVFSSQNIKAEDVCALQELVSQNASKICTDTCKQFGTKWAGQWQGKTGKTCPSPNTAGSICGCIPKCHCENGQQISCDESFNKLGENRCKTACECTSGRICTPQGWCENVPGKSCEDKCEIVYSACEQSCDLAEDPSTCFTICAWAFKTCGDNCKTQVSGKEKAKEPSSK